MASKINQVAANRGSMIPTRSNVIAVAKAKDEENGAGLKHVGAKIPVMGVPKPMATRRVGLSVLNNNIRRPTSVAIGKKTASVACPSPDETDKPVASERPKKTSDSSKTSLISSSQSSDAGVKSSPTKAIVGKDELIADLLAPDSYAPIDVSKFMTDAEISAVRSMPDPDEPDADNEFLNTEYVKDILVYLYEREIRMKLETNFLKESKFIIPRHRRMLLEWLMTVHARFRCCPETIFLAVYILDAFVAKKNDVPTNRYQLVGITAMVIAAKYEEVWPPSVDDLIALTDKAYTQAEVLRMERDILRTIDFGVARPLPITFLRRFSKLADVQTDIHCMAKFFIELSMLEYQLSGVRPSKLAVAALFLSCKLSETSQRSEGMTSTDETHSFWDARLTFFTHYPAEVILPAVYELCALLMKVMNSSNSNYVVEKYSSSKLFRVSKSPMLCSRLVRIWGSRAVLVTNDQPSRNAPSLSSSMRAASSVTTRHKLIPVRRAGSIVAIAKPPPSRPAFRP